MIDAVAIIHVQNQGAVCARDTNTILQQQQPAVGQFWLVAGLSDGAGTCSSSCCGSSTSNLPEPVLPHK
jgi:hypothetical protein